MTDGVTLLIQRGQRRARELRPATLVYAGAEFPCTPGNLEFFEQLRNGGFAQFKNLHVTLLRADVGDMVFKRGENCQVRDEISKDLFELVIGDNNSRQAAVVILNLETLTA